MYFYRQCISQPSRHIVHKVCRLKLNAFQKISFSRCAIQLKEKEPDFEHAVPILPVEHTRVTTDRVLPIITNRKLLHPSYREPKQAWLESLESIDDKKLGIVDLHPHIFGAYPRIDMLWWNIIWQKKYKKVDYRRVLSRAEMRGSTKRPWQQKGLGRARHGSRNSPIWAGGGAAFGPRGPKTDFFMLPMFYRVLGLTSALSAKFAQEHLHVVESLDIPSSSPQYLQDLIETRGWGLSVLFINETDMLTENMALAVDGTKQYTAMPVYGMNVFSLLKYETLVITLPALEIIEQKLLDKFHAVGSISKKYHHST